MKKSFLGICCFLMMTAIMSVSFVSCGGDEEEDATEVAKNEIVGTWMKENSTSYEYQYLTFNADGSGVWQQSLHGPSYEKKYSFKYVYDVKSNTIKMTFPDGDIETSEVEFISSTKMKFNSNIYVKK